MFSIDLSHKVGLTHFPYSFTVFLPSVLLTFFCSPLPLSPPFTIHHSPFLPSSHFRSSIHHIEKSSGFFFYVLRFLLSCSFSRSFIFFLSFSYFLYMCMYICLSLSATFHTPSLSFGFSSSFLHCYILCLSVYFI